MMLRLIYRKAWWLPWRCRVDDPCIGTVAPCVDCWRVEIFTPSRPPSVAEAGVIVPVQPAPLRGLHERREQMPARAPTLIHRQPAGPVTQLSGPRRHETQQLLGSRPHIGHTVRVEYVVQDVLHVILIASGSKPGPRRVGKIVTLSSNATAARR
jgi:hypothetical protein